MENKKLYTWSLPMTCIVITTTILTWLVMAAIVVVLVKQMFDGK